jgi:DNA-binding CsgD family transcriptional regulator
LQHGKEALEIGTVVGSLEKQRDANLTLSEISEALSAFDQSLAYYKSYTVIKDSLLNAEKSRQISELQTVYETEKKDQEIQLLAKNVEIDQIRKTRLWIAFGFTLLAGGLLLYGQRTRRIRDQKIHAQERELEVQHRKSAELEKQKLSRELDFKKQELAAKALQLARKNEFLQSLNEEVDGLRTKGTEPVDASVRRISRRIKRDIESEEEWEQFLSSFRGVHHNFIENIQSTYPAITKSELRLACLMKMNLSGKEIAAMLNITQEGVKKSRYRLRKKLDVDSDVDIQQFLLGLSQQR